MNLSQLKRLAEGAKAERKAYADSDTPYSGRELVDWNAFKKACDPDTILVLLSAIERAREALGKIEGYDRLAVGPALDIARSALTELDRLMEGK